MDRRDRQSARSPVLGLAAGAALIGLAVVLIVEERRRPHRPPIEEPLPHDARNLATGIIGALLTALPGLALAGLTRKAEARR